MEVTEEEIGVADEEVRVADEAIEVVDEEIGVADEEVEEVVDREVEKKPEEVEEDNRSEESDDISIERYGFEELDESHPIMKYENRILWTDKDFQKDCLKKTIEKLKNDRTSGFANSLKKIAMKTFGQNQAMLPIGTKFVPIIRFIPFLGLKSPLDERDDLQTDPQIMLMSQTIYESITRQ